MNKFRLRDGSKGYSVLEFGGAFFKVQPGMVEVVLPNEELENVTLGLIAKMKQLKGKKDDQG